MPRAARSSGDPSIRLSPSATIIAAILTLGAASVVLAAIPSTLFDLDRFSVPKELALHTAALLSAIVVLSRPQAVDLGVAELALLCFGGWSALSAVFTTNHWLGARAVGVTLSGIALFFGARFAAGRGARYLIVSGLAFAVLLGGVTGLAQTYGWASHYLADTRAPGGTLGNRNFMAHLMVLGLPLTGWLLATARRRWSIGIALLVIAFAVAAIVLSRSRAAWVGLGATIVAVLLAGLFTRGTTPRLPRRRVIALGGAMAVGALAAFGLPNRLEWKSATPYRDSFKGMLNYREGSGHGRLIQYRNSLELARRHPVLGVGPGNWVVWYPTVATPNDPSFNPVDPMPTNPWPSSDWIAVAAERGPVGLALWVAAILALAIVALRRTRDPDPAKGAAALAAIGLLAAATVQGLFDAVLLLAPPTFIVMAGLGALLPATRSIQQVAHHPARRRRALGLAAVLFLGLAVKSLGQAEAIREAEPGYPLARLADAIRFDPGSFRLNYLLAIRSPCPDAGPYARRLLALFPAHPWSRRLETRCAR